MIWHEKKVPAERHSISNKKSEAEAKAMRETQAYYYHGATKRNSKNWIKNPTK